MNTGFKNISKDGYRVKVLSEIDSTNSYLIKNYNTLPDHQVVFTKNQTGGKGRNGREWLSKKDSSFAMSILLKEGRIARDFTTLPLITGLAVLKTILPYIEKDRNLLGLKWVNDIVFNQKKIGGILCESRIFLESSIYVVGIGLNIDDNQDFFRENNLPNAISLSNITKNFYNTQDIIEGIIINFHSYYTILKSRGFKDICNEYNEKCVNINKIVKASYGQERVVGRVRKVDNNGNLVIENHKGIFYINSGEATIRGESGYY